MKQLYIFLLLSAVAMADDTNLEELLHAGNNKFTSNMFSEVAKENPGKSIIISAFSVMTPLAQLALASKGPSHDELLTSIGLPNDTITKDVFSLVNRKLTSIKGVVLITANKVYIPVSYELNPEFAAVSREVFNSDVEKVDFVNNYETAKEINTWVENQTNHRIKNLVNPMTLGSGTRAVLVNALYFKGTWENPFRKDSTKNKDFHVSKEKSVKVPMMHSVAHYKYGDSEILKSKILEMPYERKESSMLIVLPDDIDGIEALLRKMKDLSLLDKETKNLLKVQVKVSIPKFKIETTTNLKQVLSNINVNKVFSPGQANLENLLKGGKDLYISDAIQKAFIEVNEEGAEAAAANQAAVSYLLPMVPTVVHQFVADHPFLFFLKENNNILFSGIYCA